jgi:hypothetical protein
LASTNETPAVPSESLGPIKTSADLIKNANLIIENAKVEMNKLEVNSGTKQKKDNLQMAINFLNLFINDYRDKKADVSLKLVSSLLGFLKKSGNAALEKRVEEMVKVAVVMPRIEAMKTPTLNQMMLLNDNVVLVWVPRLEKMMIYKVKIVTGEIIPDGAGEEFSYDKVVSYLNPAVLKGDTKGKYLSVLVGNDFMSYGSVVSDITKQEDQKMHNEYVDWQGKKQGGKFAGQLKREFVRISDAPAVKMALNAVSEPLLKKVVEKQLEEFYGRDEKGTMKVYGKYVNANLGLLKGQKYVDDPERAKGVKMSEDVQYSVSLVAGKLKLIEMKKDNMSGNWIVPSTPAPASPNRVAGGNSVKPVNPRQKPSA